MEYLQYINRNPKRVNDAPSFKPCYKWNTFNTK